MPEGEYTSLCSAHFEASCYNFPIQLQGIQMNGILIKGSVTTCDSAGGDTDEWNINKRISNNV